MKPALQGLLRIFPGSAVAVLLALAVAWLCASLALPLGRDQGIFAWVGHVILDGGMPYRDAWEVKGPLVGALYGLALFLFGANELAVRLGDGLLFLAGAATAWHICGCWSLPASYRLICLSVLALVTRGSFWLAGQPDTWAGFAALGVLAIVLSPSPTRLKFALAGALVGAAILIKPVYVLFAGVILTAAFVDSTSFGRRAALVLSSAAGAAVVAALCVAVFAATGALGELIDVYVLFNLTQHAGAHHLALGEFAGRVVAEIFDVGTLGTAAYKLLIVVGLVSLHRRFGKRALPVTASLVIAYLAAVIQMKWYSYHFAPLDFLAVLPATYAVFAVVGPASRQPARWPALALASFICLCFAAWVKVNARDTAVTVVMAARHGLGRLPEKTWDSQFCWDEVCHRDIREAADFLRSRVAPGQPIYLWGFDALLYLLADRPSASRFGFNYPMVLSKGAYADKARGELVDTLSAHLPAAIVVQDGDANNLYHSTSRQFLEEFPALKELIARHYQRAFTNRAFEIYLRRDRTGG